MNRMVSGDTRMTGYGRKEVSGAGGHFSIGDPLGDNRYIDIQVKAPEGLRLSNSKSEKECRIIFQGPLRCVHHP
jgi:hypothetical protein